MSKRVDIKKWLLVLCIIVLLILDFINIGKYVPFLNQLNYQFWNLIIVIVLFIISYHFIESRDVRRKEAQDKTGKFLIRIACENCKTMANGLDETNMKKILLSDNDYNKSLLEQKRYVGLHDLPFADDQEIKKLALDGIINSSDFEKYVSVKNLYQNMIAMYFIAPDHPEIYQEQRSQMFKIADELINRYKSCSDK